MKTNHYMYNLKKLQPPIVITKHIIFLLKIIRKIDDSIWYLLCRGPNLPIKTWYSFVNILLTIWKPNLTLYRLLRTTALLSVTPVIKLHTLLHAWFHHSTIIYRCRQVHEGTRKYKRSSSFVLGCQNTDIKATLVTILSTQVAYRLQGLY